MRTLLALVLAATIPALPAAAAAGACETAPASLRSLAAMSDAQSARKAEQDIERGEALCNARNRQEAARRFARAARTLGTSLEVALAPATSH